MTNFIFEQQNPSGSGSTISYCLIGKHNRVDENGYPITDNSDQQSDTLAYKTIKSNGDSKFMVRINSDRKLYNPLSIYGKDKSYKLLSNITRSSIEYKEVNSRAFDFYLRFLATKNIAWLNKAEREI